MLLGFAGRNKAGRKQELQARAVDLLKLRSTPIQMKIKELHRRRFPVLSSSQKSTYTPPTTTMNQMQLLKNPPHYPSHTSAAPPSQLGNHAAPYPAVGPLDFSAKLATHHSPAGITYPVHPDVRFKHLPFYEVLAELLKPASLVPSGQSRFQENNFVFHLTPQQAHDIAISRDMRHGVKLEYLIQAQLRFCLLETSCEQDDNFPPSVCVKINSKMCPLPNPIPTNKPGVEPKRPSRPVNITPLCRLSPTVSNHVSVSWASEFGRGYAVAIYLVKRQTSAALLQKLKLQAVRNADHTRALIKEKLAHDADSEIATTSLRVSLMCPLGKMRMQFPCRAATCTHLQCFDASLYLQMNEKKPTWICPVCDKPAPFDRLVLDGLFLEIFSASPECNEIQFHEDGSWSPMMPKKETHVIGSPVVSKPPSKVSSPIATSSTGMSSTKPSEKEKVEVIDLTLDSSDEEVDVRKSDKNGSLPLRVDTSSSSSNSSAASCKTGSSSSSSSFSANSNVGNNTGCVIPHVITLDSPSNQISASSSPMAAIPSPVHLTDNSLDMRNQPCDDAETAALRKIFESAIGVGPLLGSHMHEQATAHCPTFASDSPPMLSTHNDFLQLGFIDRCPAAHPYLQRGKDRSNCYSHGFYPT